jgi:CMP/dCMP kinase
MTAKSAEGRHEEPFVVTIDGPAGVGKSTAARLLAKELGLVYLDTGATYRALAYAALRRTMHPIVDAKAISSLARRFKLKFHYKSDGTLQVLLTGRDITTAIRTEEITEAAAQIAQHPDVRKAMVACQRRLAEEQGPGVVVEGRDTGSVVFPHAAFKFFLDADPAIRAERRQREMARMYGTLPPLVQVREQLNFRDRLDRHRRVGPLVKPDGAILVDTSHLSTEEVVRQMVEVVRRSAAR